MTKLTQPLKWPGGKAYLASRIVDLMPPHLHYVEPYFGGGSVLLARDPDDTRFWLPPHKGVSEVANDIHGALMNFWRVLKNPALFGMMLRQLQTTPMSKDEWTRASQSKTSIMDNPVFAAVDFFVNARQSRAGGMKGFTSITRNRTRRQMNGNVSEWLGAVDGLPDIHARLRRVLIENMPAVDLIKREDTPGTLIYADPPYPHESRTSKDLYAHEMNTEDHEHLARVLNGIQGKAMLSGYRCDLYDLLYKDWRRVEWDLPNNMAGGATKRRMIECLWMNF